MSGCFSGGDVSNGEVCVYVCMLLFVCVYSCVRVCVCVCVCVCAFAYNCQHEQSCYIVKKTVECLKIMFQRGTGTEIMEGNATAALITVK